MNMIEGPAVALAPGAAGLVYVWGGGQWRRREAREEEEEEEQEEEEEEEERTKGIEINEIHEKGSAPGYAPYIYIVLQS